MTLFSADLVSDSFDETGHRLRAVRGRGHGIVEGDLHRPLAGEPLSFGHERERASDRDRDDGGAALERQEESAPAERPEAAIPAPRALWKDEIRIAPLTHEGGRSADALLAAFGPLTVHGHEADEPHGGADDRDAQDRFLQDDPGRTGNVSHDQRPVQEALVIGHE